MMWRKNVIIIILLCIVFQTKHYLRHACVNEVTEFYGKRRVETGIIPVLEASYLKVNSLTDMYGK